MRDSHEPRAWNFSSLYITYSGSHCVSESLLFEGSNQNWGVQTQEAVKEAVWAELVW